MAKSVISGNFYVQTAAEPGAQGDRGMLPYPAGEYSASTTYKATANTAPFVLFSGIYYVMNKVGSWLGTSTGKTPAQDYATNTTNATWIPFENFKAIYTELLFAKLGLLGSAVFYDDYMFSQYGTNASGVETSNYSGFAAGTFTPYLKLNLKTGEITAVKGTFWGQVKVPFVQLYDSDAVQQTNGRWRINKQVNIVVGVNDTIELPTDLSYNGVTVSVLNPYYPPYANRTYVGSYVRVQGNGYIRGTRPVTDVTDETVKDETFIVFAGALLRFLAVPVFNSSGQITKVEWMALGYR